MNRLRIIETVKKLEYFYIVEGIGLLTQETAKQWENMMGNTANCQCNDLASNIVTCEGVDDTQKWR